MQSVGNGSWWWKLPSFRRKSKPRRSRHQQRPGSSSSSPSPSPESISRGGQPLLAFPFKQAATACSLTLAGDTIAQVTRRISDRRNDPNPKEKDLMKVLFSNHDGLRALRMASYGFLLYGPGSFAWYQFLEHCMPKRNLVNLSAKVILNQIVLGPCVIAVVFAWNNLWLGKLSQLPLKYQNDALPTLLYGFKFWIPVSIINFGIIPLAARVAFMSSCSIFWNFYLSTTLSK